ncbi:CHASE3 domain-containing protein [Fimbriiglobus ruber]|uniref:histidine kinase n=1 Tax=Fimbriiglobus ruber TaxID=1908690 RepID=A0A225DGF8_9BACT|nr:CHASE3 domain-containing protein [Fimbriiglobus ruber]OWK35485.1 Phytochrome, two-component sensor histidine kinase [Fimbriiglobus ruber]
MNLTVFQKGWVLVIVPLLFQTAFVLVVVRFQREYVAAEQLAIHTKDVIVQTHEIDSHVSAAAAGIRGYVIARDPAFDTSFRDARRDLPGHLDDLDEMIGDNPAQGIRAKAVRTAVDAVLIWQQEVERLVQNGAADEAAARIRSGTGQELIAEFRREIGTFLAEEERLDRERRAVTVQSRNRLNTLFAGGGVAAVACTLVLAYAFRRGIASRFATLEANTRRLAAGEALPPPLVGTDEIAGLDRAFRAMAAELTRTSDTVRDLYDNAPCGYHSVNPDGSIVAMNRTELGWLGYAAGEVIGRLRFAEMVHPNSRNMYLTIFDRLKEQGTASDIEFDLLRKDGTTFPVLVNSIAVRDADGRYVRSRTTLTDISERKRTEAAMRLFADVAQSIPIGLLIYQLDGMVLRVRSGNRDAARLLGVPLDDAIGRPVVEVFPEIPEDQLRRYTAVAASGVADDLGEFRYGDARVAERWWQVLAFPLADRSVGVSFQDVSDRKRADAEIRRLNAELEDRVRARTAELEAVNRDLAQKNTENEMFVYSVSHDLRSPLVNLQGFSKELEKGAQKLAAVLADGTVPSDVRNRGRALLNGNMTQSIGFIQTAVMRLSGIIDALLRLSRAGRIEYRRESVDMGRVVAQVLGAAHGTITERRAAVRVGELPPVWGDRTAIEQVFGNLIGNALTYLDPGRPGVIEVGCLLPPAMEGFRTYFVRDNGLGIAEGHRSKIFQAFQRSHPGIGSGEGLGLAIVSRVAERHRGRVWVESHPGAGSTFFVALPITPEAGGR